MSEKLDKETQQTLREDKDKARFVKSREWLLIKGMLEEKIKVLNSITSLPDKVDDLTNELMIRKGAISIIEEWIAEVEGYLGKSEFQKNIDVEEQNKEVQIIDSVQD